MRFWFDRSRKERNAFFAAAAGKKGDVFAAPILNWRNVLHFVSIALALWLHLVVLYRGFRRVMRILNWRKFL